MSHPLYPTHLYEEAIEILLIFIAACIIVFGILALVVLNRTKTTPCIARFMTSWLIIFDLHTVIFFTLRKLVNQDFSAIILHIVGVLGCFLSYITICLMSIERMIVFSLPNFYLKHVTLIRVKVICYTVWIGITLLYFIARNGACHLLETNVSIYDLVMPKCTKYLSVFLYPSSLLVVSISMICYIKIFIVVRTLHRTSPRSSSSTIKTLIRYKSTSVVLAYVLVMVTTTTAFIVIFVVHNQYEDNVNEVVVTQTVLDFTSMMTCVLDPCLYILWFRECRMVLMKIFCSRCDTYASRIERMRLEVFHIVTKRDSPNLDP